MPKSKTRPRFSLECTICTNLNYRTNKNPRNTTDRLNLTKYCKHCQKATLHKETK